MKVKISCISVKESDYKSGFDLICETDRGQQITICCHDKSSILDAASMFGLIDEIKHQVNKHDKFDFDADKFRGKSTMLNIEPDCGGLVN